MESRTGRGGVTFFVVSVGVVGPVGVVASRPVPPLLHAATASTEIAMVVTHVTSCRISIAPTTEECAKREHLSPIGGAPIDCRAIGAKLPALCHAITPHGVRQGGAPAPIRTRLLAREIRRKGRYQSHLHERD